MPNLRRPKHTPVEKYLAIFMSANALIQFLLDIVLEVLHIIPTRVNHLSLTLLNAFISFKTLSAIKKNRFTFMHEDCQILWLMEICLIAGDVYYLLADEFSLKFIYVRVVFCLLSLLNLMGVSYIILKYQLWDISYQGHAPNENALNHAVNAFKRGLKKKAAAPVRRMSATSSAMASALVGKFAPSARVATANIPQIKEEPIDEKDEQDDQEDVEAMDEAFHADDTKNSSIEVVPFVPEVVAVMEDVEATQL